MKKILCALIGFLILASGAQANFVFTDWNQTIQLTPQGRTVTVTTAAKVKLKPNYYYNSWIYIFTPSQQIQIQAVKVNGQTANYDFNNNQLNIHFSQLFDGAQVEFQIDYLETEAHEVFYRQNWIQLPGWLAGAKAQLTVQLPESQLLCSGNPEFTRGEQTLSWQGTVPPGGFKSLLKFTPASAQFKIDIENNLTGTLPYKKVRLKYPQYFNFPSQIVTGYQVLPNLVAQNVTLENAYHVLNFENAASAKVTTHIVAQVQTGPFNGVLSDDPKKFLNYSATEKAVLDRVIKRIGHQPNTLKLPEHVRIGQWVNNYLKYDLNMSGKRLSNTELLRNPKGVCEHFAQLYQTLLRYQGIPAFTVSGYAFNAERGWDAHAWVLVYSEGRWWAMDPTWGLFTGVLPASHIYFYREGVNQSRFETINYTGESKMQTKVSIQNL